MDDKAIAKEDTFAEVGGRRVLVARAGQPLREMRQGYEAVAGGDVDTTAGAPAKSAKRGEWDAYAASIGLDPTEYDSKDAVIAAVEGHAPASEPANPDLT